MTDVWEKLYGASVILSTLFGSSPGAGDQVALSHPLLYLHLFPFPTLTWGTLAWMWGGIEMMGSSASPASIVLSLPIGPSLISKDYTFET